MSSDEMKPDESNSAAPAIPAVEETLVKRFDVFAGKDEVEGEIDKLAHEYVHKVKIPGFRQGKVPVDVVKASYKKALADEVIEQLIRKLAFARIEADKLAIAMTPVAEKIDYHEGGDLSASIAVEVFPEVPLPEIAGLQVEVPKDKLKPEEYDEAKQIERVLLSRERSVPVQGRPLQENDLAMFSLQVKFLDNKRMAAKKDSYFLMKKEGTSEIIDLYGELLGKQVGDKVSFSRSYPKEHGKKAWAGKEIEHFLEIKNIYELKKPDIDAEFLKSVGAATAEEFKKKLREEFTHHAAHRHDEIVLEHIFDKLIALVQMPVPASLVREEIRDRLSRQQAPLQFAGEEDKAKFRTELLASAQKSVKLSLILDEVRKRYKIEVKDEDIQNEYKHLAQHHGVPEKDIRKYYGDKERYEQLKGQVLDTKVLDFLKSQTQIKEV